MGPQELQRSCSASWQPVPWSTVLLGVVGFHLVGSSVQLADFCPAYGTLTMQLCEQAAGSSMADRPGGTGRHTERAKIGTRARTVLWVGTDSTVTLVLTGDGMVDYPESSAVSASSAPSQTAGGPCHSNSDTVARKPAS